jgi:hypothetical protein
MNHKRYQDSEFYFDDCPICRAVKKAEDENRDLTYDELKKAFDKAKKQGKVISGEL